MARLLSEFRVLYGEALDALLARSLAALVEEGVIDLELVAPDTLTAQALAGASSARRHRRFQVMVVGAAARINGVAMRLTETTLSPTGGTTGRLAGASRSSKVRASMRRSRE